MNCREALEHLHEHIDGECSPWTRFRMRAHLFICSQCRRYLRSYKKTLQVEKAAFDDRGKAVNAAIPEDLVASILAAVKKPANSPDGNRVNP